MRMYSTSCGTISSSHFDDTNRSARVGSIKLVSMEEPLYSAVKTPFYAFGVRVSGQSGGQVAGTATGGAAMSVAGGGVGEWPCRSQDGPAAMESTYARRAP